MDKGLERDLISGKSYPLTIEPLYH